MNGEQLGDPGNDGALTGGELNAAVTREVVRIHTAKLGRGPKKSFSFYNGNVLVTIMQQVTTHAEQNLAGFGEGEAVRELRRLFQGTMTDELKAAVEAVTRRRVVALLSDNHIEPDLAVQVFILDGDLE